MKGKNFIKMEIRKLLPDDWTATIRYQFSLKWLTSTGRNRRLK